MSRALLTRRYKRTLFKEPLGLVHVAHLFLNIPSKSDKNENKGEEEAKGYATTLT